ncbi:flagellar biosynthetic protein FliR [Ralstonia pickettii]|nr:flagellar biosynthetic protein FliR [Ralstonia pickettii]
MTPLRMLFRHSLAWPVLTLALLFALDVAHRPGFLSIALLDGHLFGALVDILNRAAPQIGVFQIGFPVTMLVGLLLVQLMVPNLVPFVSHLFDMGVDAMGRVLIGWR